MLRIIADDLGLHTSVNDGIIFLLKTGKIEGASLMTNANAFDDAITRLKSVPSANIGIHINFVEERSLISGKLMPKNHRIFFFKYLLGLVKKEYIKEEAEAQIRKCIQAGIKPSFINGNQHLHLLPGIMDIMIGLAKKYGIPYVRVINESTSFGTRKVARNVQLLFLNFLSKLAKPKIKKAGLLHNDYFVGFINAGNLTRGDILKAEKISYNNPDQIVELGCHPGFEDEMLKENCSHWKYNWKKELELLNSL